MLVLEKDVLEMYSHRVFTIYMQTLSNVDSSSRLPPSLLADIKLN